MSTSARPSNAQSGSHYYFQDGRPCYEIAKKDGSGMRPTTLADARKLNLLPSVTTILGILDKPALTTWKIEQACLSVLTAPKQPGEELDAFIERVLHTERQQDQEASIARDKGTEIHSAMESLCRRRGAEKEIWPWVMPAFEAISKYGEIREVEKILVGKDIAGKTDLLMEAPDCFWLWDWKSCKKLPKNDAWLEHRLQASAYARMYAAGTRKQTSEPLIKTGNVYISTVNCGEFVICEHVQNWQETWTNGFYPLVEHWQWAKGYKPEIA